MAHTRDTKPVIPNTEPRENTPRNYSKICTVLLYTSYTLTVILFTLNTINSIIITNTIKHYYIWVYIGGYFIYLPISLGIYYTTFLLFKAFKSYLYYFSLTIINIMVVLLIMYNYKKRYFLAVLITFLIIIGVFDLFSFIVSFYIKLPSLLFNMASESVFQLKNDIFKNNFKKTTILFTYLYISLTSVRVALYTYVTVAKKNISDYTRLCFIGTTLYSLLSLFIVIYNSRLENILLGVLLFMDNYKTKLKNDNKIKKGLNCFDELNKEDIRNKFYSTSTNDYVFYYGRKTRINIKHKQITLSATFLDTFKEGMVSLKYVVTLGSFIYSYIYNVGIEEATKMYIRASYHSGYLELINIPMLLLFINLIGFMVSIMFTLCILALFIIPIIINANIKQANIWIIVYISLLTFITTNVAIGMVSGLIYGYSKAIVCLFIEDPAKIVVDRRYWKRLKKYMQGVCKNK